MRKSTICTFFGTLMGALLGAQVQTVNISGSYNEAFLLRGETKEYKIIGSPYLSEDWMYGTIEMKRATVEGSGSSNRERARLKQAAFKIDRINELIAQITDSGYQTTGLSILKHEVAPMGGDLTRDVRITTREFSELSGITRELEEKLIQVLTALRSEYESEISEIHKINGLFRYNLYAQEFEMVFEQDTFAIIAPFEIQNIYISNKKFIYGFYVDRAGIHDFLGSSYFEVLNEGNSKLLVRHDVRVKSGGGPATYQWAGGADAFVKFKQLYYQRAEGAEVKLLKRSKRGVLKIFADKYEQIEKFIKDEHINMKDENELARIFAYYNSLDS